MIYKYFGPPGTGKTHKLISRAKAYIRVGTPLDRIGYFAFTKNHPKPVYNSFNALVDVLFPHACFLTLVPLFLRFPFSFMAVYRFSLYVVPQPRKRLQLPDALGDRPCTKNKEGSFRRNVHTGHHC